MKKIAKKQPQYNVIFSAEPEGGFTVSVPSLPGCVSYGKTLSEAQDMILDAIDGYILSMKKHGELIPSDEQTFVGRVNVGGQLLSHA